MFNIFQKVTSLFSLMIIVGGMVLTSYAYVVQMRDFDAKIGLLKNPTTIEVNAQLTVVNPTALALENAWQEFQKALREAIKKAILSFIQSFFDFIKDQIFSLLDKLEEGLNAAFGLRLNTGAVKAVLASKALVWYETVREPVSDFVNRVFGIADQPTRDAAAAAISADRFADVYTETTKDIPTFGTDSYDPTSIPVSNEDTSREIATNMSEVKTFGQIVLRDIDQWKNQDLANNFKIANVFLETESLKLETSNMILEEIEAAKRETAEVASQMDSELTETASDCIPYQMLVPTNDNPFAENITLTPFSGELRDLQLDTAKISTANVTLSSAIDLAVENEPTNIPPKEAEVLCQYDDIQTETIQKDATAPSEDLGDAILNTLIDLIGQIIDQLIQVVTALIQKALNAFNSIVSNAGGGVIGNAFDGVFSATSNFINDIGPAFRNTLTNDLRRNIG